MRTVPTRIAIVADCDDTLAPDTTAQLLRRFGVDPEAFYGTNTRSLVDEGYDPPLAYMSEMLRLAQKGGPLEGLTRDSIRQAGAELDFYPGVPAVFEALEEEIEGTYGHLGIRLEEYVVTGGIADLIAASPLARVVDDMWGCNFAYDEAGKIAGIRNVVSFTEKTRFLFNIEKGLVGATVRGQPYAVNVPLDADERPVPMRNMVYLGDGPSDVPCMSIIQRAQGWVIRILNRHRLDQAWALGYGRRANVTVPPDFRNGEHGWSQLREAVIQTAERIKIEESDMTTKAPLAQVSSGDVLKHTWEVTFGPHGFVARVDGSRTEFSFSGEAEPFGYVRSGSARSGSIWLGADCIGEYEQVSEALTTVTPITRGRRVLEMSEQIDPLTFLLREAVQRLRRQRPRSRRSVDASGSGWPLRVSSEAARDTSYGPGAASTRSPRSSWHSTWKARRGWLCGSIRRNTMRSSASTAGSWRLYRSRHHCWAR